MRLSNKMLLGALGVIILLMLIFLVQMRLSLRGEDFSRTAFAREVLQIEVSSADEAGQGCQG